MTKRTQTTDNYADELARWARAMAVGRDDEIQGALDEGSFAWQLSTFVEDNMEKRRQLIAAYLPFVRPAFDDFDDLLMDYIEEVPMVALDTPTGDAERFLGWLEVTAPLTPEQQDYVACQRARHAVEEAARKNRSAHVRFQELWSVAAELAPQLGKVRGMRIHLNPLRAWARFVTPALLNGVAAPADVVFFPARESINAAVPGDEGRALIEELAEFGPCTLAKWATLSAHGGRKELAAACRNLAAVGLVAFS
jgi:hypothetical protein